MENIYTAYIREVNGVDFYFVKKYNIFPEVTGSLKVLESFGMHSNFYRACDIAKIYDEATINKLLNGFHIRPEDTKIAPVKPVNALTHSLRKTTQQVILKLRWAGIN